MQQSRHGQGGMVFGFFTPDIRATSKVIQDAGGVLIGGLNVVPHIGVDGGDYAYRFYRAQYGRVYGVSAEQGIYEMTVKAANRLVLSETTISTKYTGASLPQWQAHTNRAAARSRPSTHARQQSSRGSIQSNNLEARNRVTDNTDHQASEANDEQQNSPAMEHVPTMTTVLPI